MGSTVENEEKIRRITYSYRQHHRYKEAELEQKEQETSQQQVEQQTSSNEQYKGKKQEHREEDN